MALDAPPYDAGKGFSIFWYCLLSHYFDLVNNNLLFKGILFTDFHLILWTQRCILRMRYTTRQLLSLQYENFHRVYFLWTRS
jgi:hypothetical protein